MKIIHLYYRLGEQEKADALAQEFFDATEKNIKFFFKRYDGDEDLYYNLAYMRNLTAILEPYNQDLYKKARELFIYYASATGFYDDKE